MTIEEALKLDFEKIHIKDRSKVEIMDVVKIDNRLWGRYDLIIKQYYNNNLNFLPFLYYFNGITNPIEINLGTLIQIPDIYTLNQQLELIHNDENTIPGIVKYTDNRRANAELRENNINGSTTTALPKLSITMEKIKYDSDNGTIIL
jgi:hypothetical protein